MTNEWDDPNFQVELDTREGPETMAAALAKIADEEPNTQGLEPEVPVVVPPVVKTPPAPEVIELDGGMSVKIEQDSVAEDGSTVPWKATLEANTGARPEVFSAKTQKDLMKQVFVAKVNATKKINQQEKQLKLSRPETPVQPVQPTVTGGKVLTADDEFQFNADFKANPAKAIEKWYQTRLGQAPEETARISKAAQETTAASLQILSVQESKQFLSDNSNYLRTDSNFTELLKYLVKYQPVDDYSRQLVRIPEKQNELVLHLTRLGVFNSDNLSEAFNELSEAGLLELAPEPKPVARATEVVEEPVAEPPATQRIANVRRVSRVANGLTQRETVQGPPAVSPTAPSVEELENATDDEIAKLLQGVRSLAAKTRR